MTLLPPTRAAVSGQQVLGPSSAQWEASFIWRPFVINTGSMFMMWYSGEAKNGIDSIGLATSKDGITWTRYPQNPVLTIGAPDQWDSGSVNEAWVTKESGEYKMWYSGQIYNPKNNTVLSYAIGYATSSDGIHWTKYPGNPIFRGGASGSWDYNWVYRPMVIATSLPYRMYYHGPNLGQTGFATSTDGVHWTGQGMITIQKGTWDAYANALSSVTVTPGGYLMAYHGVDSKQSSHYQIGFASSTDGINSTPYAENPVIAPEIGKIAWDSLGVNYPMVVTVGDEYYVYYSGYTSAIEAIGLAILPTSQFPVPEFSSTQLLTVAAILASVVSIEVIQQHRSYKSGKER